MRTAKMTRKPSESAVELELNLDGTGQSQIDTGVPFFDHMLTALSKHFELSPIYKWTRFLFCSFYHVFACCHSK